MGRSAAATPHQVAAAYDAATAAVRSWRDTPAVHRGSVLARAATLIEERLEEIATGLTLEEGKPISDARAEVARAAAIFRYHAGECQQPSGEIYTSASPGTIVQTTREPLGVVCAITPWNFPIAIPAWKIAPSLAFGNTVVWKPAELASGTAALLTCVLADAGLPDGVLNLVTGSGAELSDALLGRSIVRGVTFTGSNAVGRAIAARAAERGIRAQLEMGGKNPAVVLDDADLERASTCITRSAMLAAGQRCTATSRVIATAKVYDELISRLIEGTKALAVGDPMDEATMIGPLASAAQFKKVSDYLEQAASEGLASVLGGCASDPTDGFFVEPTIYVDVDPGSPIATEEIFGPVIAVILASDAADAIRLANDTEYGLSGSIFTRDLRTAVRAARELEAGVVHINGESTGAEPHVPFGGMKASSSGFREQGKAAREFFTETKTTYIEDL